MITVRKPQYEFDKHAPSYWYADNKFATCFFSALSATFPAGEKFFIQSVRDNLGPCGDKLRDDVKAFNAQEGQHSLRHMEFNEWLDYKGYNASQFEDVIKVALSLASKLPKKHRLAVTCALEHITSIMAERLIGEADIYATKIEPTFREFWQWHALEEEEHKSVAFEVYRANDYDEATRMAAMILSTAGLIVGVVGGQLWMIYSKKSKRGPIDLIQGLNLLYGTKGFVSRSIPAYLTYFKPGFHPTDRDQ